MLGDASEEDAQKLYDFGIKMGLAFQLQDDFWMYMGIRKYLERILEGISCVIKNVYAD